MLLFCFTDDAILVAIFLAKLALASYESNDMDNFRISYA